MIRPAIRRKGLRGLPQFFRRFDALRSEKIGSPARRVAAATRSLTPLAYSVGSFRQFTKGDISMSKITYIDGGSPEYWRQRKEAFRLIREAEAAGERMKKAPMYLHGGYDADGDVIAIENLGPHDDFMDAVHALEANETAVSILAAQQRTEICGVRITAEYGRASNYDPEIDALLNEMNL